MSEQEFKKRINYIVTSIIIATILNIGIVGWGVYNSSYKSSIVNDYQDKAIDENKKGIRENKELFYHINEQITELKILIKNK